MLRDLLSYAFLLEALVDLAHHLVGVLRGIVQPEIVIYKHQAWMLDRYELAVLELRGWLAYGLKGRELFIG